MNDANLSLGMDDYRPHRLIGSSTFMYSKGSQRLKSLVDTRITLSAPRVPGQPVMVADGADFDGD